MLNDHIVKTKGVHGILDTSVLEINANRNQPNGYAGLDSSGRVLAANLPVVPPNQEFITNKNQANGYAGLNSTSKLTYTQLPCGTIQKHVTRQIVGPNSYNNTAYSSVYNPINFTKILPNSNIIVSISFSGYLGATSSPGLIIIGAALNTGTSGTVADVAQFYFNTIGQHYHWTGEVDLGQTAAVTYNLQAYLRVSSGILFQLDGNDQFTMHVEEVLNLGS